MENTTKPPRKRLENPKRWAAVLLAILNIAFSVWWITTSPSPEPLVGLVNSAITLIVVIAM